MIHLVDRLALVVAALGAIGFLLTFLPSLAMDVAEQKKWRTIAAMVIGGATVVAIPGAVWYNAGSAFVGAILGRWAFAVASKKFDGMGAVAPAKKESGFTLIELLIVIAIIAVLAIVACNHFN